MIRRFLAALLIAQALAFQPQPAFGNPTDGIPPLAEAGPATPANAYATYKTAFTNQVYTYATPGDGVTANGGTPPSTSFAPTQYHYAGSRTNWNLASSSYFPCPGAQCSEIKFRTLCVDNGVAANDPLRNYGQPGASHPHNFFGSPEHGASATYASITSGAAATGSCDGGPLNHTLYWFPAMERLFGGVPYVIRPSVINVYYIGRKGTETSVHDWVPGTGFVWGFNMDDPDNTEVKLEVANANAANLAAGKGNNLYQIIFPDGGFVGYYCSNDAQTTGDTGHYRYLRKSDGTAMFNCPAGNSIVADLLSPGCWNGTHLQVAKGYRHMRQWIRASTTGGNYTEVCPDGFWRVPVINLKVQWKIWDDNWWRDASLGGWFLSSDAPAQTTCNIKCSPSRTIQPGESMHADWFGGWDDDTENFWEDFCNGIFGNGVGNLCDSSTVGSNLTLRNHSSGNQSSTGAADKPEGRYLVPAMSGMVHAQ